MKNILYLLFLLPVLVFAQGSNENYIQTTTYKQPTPLPLNTPTLLEANIGVTYFDGLGRPIQQVAVGQSGLGNNIVTPILYDIYGRQDKDYLPVPISNASMLFVDNSTVIGDPTSYYSTTYGADGAYRFSEKRFESSPLNRVLEQGAPGEDWSLANNHTIKMDYQTNESDEVKFYKAVATYNASSALYDVSLSIGATSHYLHNTLYKSIVKDENWTAGQKHTTEEFKNQEGQVVLKRTYNSINEVTTPHDTYYVYDQYGNLSFVVPPLAEEATNSSVLNELCYQYKYDSRNRLVEKKLPGKQWEYIVYDKLDRVVATGPTLAPFVDLINGNKQGWLITKYDGFNRVVLTGWKESNFTADTRFLLQRQIDLPNYYNESRTQRSVINQVNSVSFNYTNVAWPTLDYHILTVNYYDDYDYTGAPSTYIVTLDGINQAFYNNTTQKPKGLPTGSWVRVLESSTDIKAEISYTLYDKKARPVKTYSTNHLGGFISTEIKLDFIGKTLYTITQHKKEAISNLIQVREDFTYSPQDRLLTHTHKVNGNPTELLAKNDYDNLGQLKRKSVGATDISGTASLQKVDYSYNIRGWLNNINDVNELTISGEPTDLFAFRINYNLPENTLGGQIESLYNGNISETLWRTDSDNVKRSYGYQYDELNRLLKANYQKGDTATETRSYDEKLHYDKNGNIKRLERNGFIDSDSQGMSYPIDDLIYTYANGNNSNQLLAVLDNSNSIDGFKDGNLNGTDYRYDDYRNMIEDKNKKIDKIFYNHLNLPVRIEFDNSTKIEYLYNAVGLKLTKTVTGLNEQDVTLYFSEFQYKNNELQFFPTAEGYVSVTNGDKFNYVYNYTDHLGNIRVSYSLDQADGQLKILEENHYYPYGLKHSNYNNDRVEFDKDENGGIFAVLRPVVRSKYQYKYNGKEFQDELGLNFYDYGARNYDPAIGRWMNIDPMAGKWQEYSPYNYTLNNPMFFVDPNGEDVYLFYYVKSSNEEDNSMFMNSALTRAKEMLSTMKEGDAYKISFVEDLGTLGSTIESDVKELSPKYGGTREVGIFSHAGLDGPIGSKPASKDALYNKGDLGQDGRAVPQNSTQLSIKGWSKIDFNWINDGKSKANFFGCNTGRDPDGDGPRKSFTTTLSGLANFRDVKVGGQASSSYPSMFTNVRETNSAMRSGDFKNQTTYMVGAPPLGVGGRWNSTPANPMIQSVNGETVGPFYQAGKSKK